MGKLTNLKPQVSSMPTLLRPPPKTAESFYQSPEWRSLVASIKRTRGSWCEQCGAGPKVIGDHIRERKDGGADLDPSNVQLLCWPCHNRKTAKARAARAKGMTRA